MSDEKSVIGHVSWSPDYDKKIAQDQLSAPQDVLIGRAKEQIAHDASDMPDEIWVRGEPEKTGEYFCGVEVVRNPSTAKYIRADKAEAVMERMAKALRCFAYEQDDPYTRAAQEALREYEQLFPK